MILNEQRLAQRTVLNSSELTDESTAIALATVLKVSRSDVWLATCLQDGLDISLDKVLALQVGDISIWETSRGKCGVEVRLNRSGAQGKRGVSMVVPAEALPQAAHLNLSSKLAASTSATDMLFNFTKMMYVEEISRIARAFFPGIAQSAGVPLDTPSRNKKWGCACPLGLMTSCLRWLFESAPEDLCVAFLLTPPMGDAGGVLMSRAARPIEVLKCKLYMLRGLGPELATCRLSSNLLLQLTDAQVQEMRRSAAGLGTGRRLTD